MKPTKEEVIEVEKELEKLAHHAKFASKQEILLKARNLVAEMRQEFYED